MLQDKHTLNLATQRHMLQEAVAVLQRIFLAGFLGLGRATAFAALSLRLNLFVVFSSALRGLPPALPSKLDGGGIFLLCQISGIDSPTIMH